MLYETAGQQEETAISELLVLPGGLPNFTQDGAELVTTSRDGLVRGYLLDPARLIAFAHSRLTRWWTEEECRQFLHARECPAEPTG